MKRREIESDKRIGMKMHKNQTPSSINGKNSIETISSLMMLTEHFRLDIGVRSLYENGTRVRLYAHFSEWAIERTKIESEQVGTL